MTILTHKDASGNDHYISQKEYDLIAHCGLEHMVKSGVNVTSVIKMCAEFSFIHNRQGKREDSLRRCLKAISDCTPYRCTPEYDALIEL